MRRDILLNFARFLLSLLIYLIIITSFGYFNVLNYKTISILNYIFILLLFMTNGFILGRKSPRKGYLTGALIGLLNIVLILLLAFILKTDFKLNYLVYFLELLLSSTIGGMIGINYKKEQ